MSGPNRKLTLEVLENGTILIATNFDDQGGIHEMRNIEAHDDPHSAAAAARTILSFIPERWRLSGDGSVPKKPEWLIRHQRLDPIEDDIPF